MAIDRIEHAAVMYMVMAWRIARLMRLGRSCLELDAQLMFEPDEWKAAYTVSGNVFAAPRPSGPHEQVASEWELVRAALALRQI